MSGNRPIRDWQGRRVWILGASSGIGEALARELAGRGARVALSARRAARLDALCDEIPGAIAVSCDAAHIADIEAACTQVIAGLGGIDLAIYAAGVWHPQPAGALDPAAIDATLAVNLAAPMHFCRLVVPALRHRSGALALVGSVAGYRPLPQAALYGSSKAALNYFAGTLHLELSPAVGVFLINPGFVDTPMTQTNRFHMPALMPVADAARAIVAGFAAGDFEIHFPKRFTRTLRAARHLPDALYFPLARRLK